MSFDFTTTTHGKWILAGEHAVLRGCPALVFPVRSCSLQLSIQKSDTLALTGANGIQEAVNKVIQRALELLDKPESELTGQLEIQNTIPVGCGMGASAALCVAIGRWMHWLGWLHEHDLFEFACELENLFHGESSGADVMVAMTQQGMLFARHGTSELITLNWQPIWLLTHSGTQGNTAECIARVKELLASQPPLGQHIDESMRKSVQLAQAALRSDTSAGHAQLAEAINQASDCFQAWGLITPTLAEHQEMLKQHGALASKPTGSGAGGFVLSLWKKMPENLPVTPMVI
ncbi:MAG: mevalonate kinase [marine bacterium B5-7]|nr:MAG: mevalonate kinase [marine bacterium B5-7]